MSPSFIDFIVQPVNLAFAAAALVTAAMLLWPTLGRGRGSSSRSVLEVTQLINSRNAVVFDVRDAEAFAKGSVTGARNMPSDMLAKRSGDLAKFKARPV